MPESPSASRKGGGGSFIEDPLTGHMAEVRAIQPYQALKVYRCPGCNHEIAAATFHYVIVPLEDTSARRHWHRGCFEHRGTRRPGR
jgi:hypothetical protein